MRALPSWVRSFSRGRAPPETTRLEPCLPGEIWKKRRMSPAFFFKDSMGDGEKVRPETGLGSKRPL